MKQSPLAKIAAKPIYLPPAAALFMCLLIEILARHSLVDALRFVAEEPLRFFVNFAIIALTYSTVLLTKRFLFTSVIVTALWLTLGITNCVLMRYRGMPLTAEDFTILGDALSIMHVYVTPVMAVLILISFAAAALLAVMVWRRAPHSAMPRVRGLLCMLMAVSIMALSVTAAFSEENFEEIPVLDTTAQSESLGFPLSFARTIFERGMDEPEDYSRENAEAALSLIPEKKSSAEVPNLIFVQLESFFDITRIEGLDFAEDPIPNFRALANENPGGALTVPTVGGGTANTEFELLTGISCTLFGPGEYPYSSILTEKSAPSLASGLAAAGCSTHAIHNHTATFYDRNTVYANLGFDDFTSVEYMQEVECNPLGWAKDSILTGEILHALAATEERDFIFAVSVQGHGKYPDEFIDEAESEIVGLTDEESEAQYAYYTSQLREMDAFVGELYRALQNLDEPAIAVFYGDHLPALGIDEASLSGDRFETEYVIASNFDLGIPAESTNLPLCTYELAAYVLSLCDMDAGPLFRLREASLCGEVSSDACEEAMTTLAYDLLYGSRYAGYRFENEGISLTKSPLQLGLHPIGITRVKGEQNRLIVEGENFTEASRIVIDGSIRDDTRYEEGRLILDGHPVTGRSRISVVQVAEDGSVLSTTPSVEIQVPASLPLRLFADQQADK